MASPKITLKKVKNALSERLRLTDPVFFLEISQDGRVVGDIVSQSFRGKQDDWRQDKIWKALEDEFGVSARQGVGMLLAYSIDEWNLPYEDEHPERMIKPSKKAG